MIRYVVLLAFAIRLAAAFQWQQVADREGKLFRFGDSESYWVLASKLAAGKPYDYCGETSRIFRTPLYPLFLAPTTYLGDRPGILLARMAGVIAGIFCVALIAITAQQLGGRLSGICAGLLAAVYPGAIGMSVFVLSEAIFCPLMLLSIVCWTKRDDHRWFAYLSGLACGLACLARPSFFLWPVWLAFFCLWIALRASRDMPPSSHSLSGNNGSSFSARIPSFFQAILPLSNSLLAFAMGMVVIMSPWWYRNYTITHRFVPTTLQVGASLYDGLHSGASGGSDEGMAFVIPFAEQLKLEESELIDRDKASKTPPSADTFEWKLNQRLFYAAIDWATQNRSDACRLALIKFVKMWSPWPTAKEVGGMAVRISESVAYIVIIVCAGIGLFVACKRREAVWLYALPTFYFAALHLVFASSVRYRQPAILVLCVVAGIGAAWMLERIARQRRLSKTGKP
jgi:Dolichyl-phosphate-mannose-protein mannosyltransferase